MPGLPVKVRKTENSPNATIEKQIASPICGQFLYWRHWCIKKRFNPVNAQVSKRITEK